MSEAAGLLEYKLGLLQLIDQTAKFEEATRTFSDATWHNAGKIALQDFQLLCAISYDDINNGLQAIGGLEVDIDATDSTPAHQVLLTGWGGRHPDTADIHLWVARPLKPLMIDEQHMWAGIRVNPAILSVSLAADSTEEIRQKLLATTALNV